MWARRALLIPILRRRMHVTVRRLPHATVYGLDCSPEETAELEAVDGHDIVDLLNAIRFEVGQTRTQPFVRVLCFGRNARTERVPWPISQYLKVGHAWVWVRKVNAAVMMFNDNDSARNYILHELGHAFIDQLTDTFPYPYALEEGFVGLVCNYLWPLPHLEAAADRASYCHPESWRGLDDADVIPIRELLLYRTEESQFPREDKTAEEFARLQHVATLSRWLVSYLCWLGWHRPIVRRILREARERQLHDPRAIYEWLLHKSEMSEQELEKSFYLFCTQGRFP